MKKLMLVALTIFSVSLGLSAQDFEGIIEFKKQEGSNVENMVWYVKGDLVRVDQFEPKSRILKSALLINTKDSSVTFIDHHAKTHQRNVASMTPSILMGCVIEETKNSKEMLTYKTSEYTVKLPGDTANYSYWISSGKFGFFKTAAWLFGSTNNYFNYYWALEPKSGTMPMLVTKSNAKGEETGRLEVTRVDKKAIDEKLFSIPAEYKEK